MPDLFRRLRFSVNAFLVSCVNLTWKSHATIVFPNNHIRPVLLDVDMDIYMVNKVSTLTRSLFISARHPNTPGENAVGMQITSKQALPQNIL